MKRLTYQWKNTRRDKMCILTFLLPVFVGIALRLISGVNFQAVGETSFGVLKKGLSDEAAVWLEANGSVAQYESESALREAVNDPSTQMIGVLDAGGGIRTLLSGDELDLYRVIAETLPQLYERRTEKLPYKRTVVPVQEDHDGLKSLLLAITLVTAMFMGCTFNAMNIISEKEDGVALINSILPMTARSYILQKIMLGIIGGTASTVITAVICVRIPPARIGSCLLLILLSAYISALAGLFIGYFSEGMMVGIIYIKIAMILFLAPPIFFYLMVPDGSVWRGLSCLLPSGASFYGLMDLLGGNPDRLGLYILILLAHAVVWSVFYAVMRKERVLTGRLF
jgi:hypothetical protein